MIVRHYTYTHMFQRCEHSCAKLFVHLFGPLLGRHGWHTFEAPEQHCLLRHSGGAFRLAKGAKAIGIGDVGVLMGVRGAQRSSF